MSKVTLTVRDKYLRKKYTITEAVYFEMVKHNKGLCWICDRAPKLGKSFNVDHDHKTGQVRGLLCFFCNKYMIGRRRKQHAEQFLRAAAYLKSELDWRTKCRIAIPKTKPAAAGSTAKRGKKS